jgi:hypothetical protein
MEQMRINNTAELLNFINREDITAKQAIEIVCKAFGLIYLGEEMQKDKVIFETERFINLYCNKACEKPLFFALEDYNNFKISDAYRVSED